MVEKPLWQYRRRLGCYLGPHFMGAINNWCGKDKNAFKEEHALGVRRLVTGEKLLSQIK